MAVRKKQRPPTKAEIRRSAEKTIIRPLFLKLRSKSSDPSIPDAVFQNRRKRAFKRLSDALVSRGSTQVPFQLEKKLAALARSWAEHNFDDGFQEAEDFEIQRARERDLVVALESGDLERIRKAREQELRRQVIQHYGAMELRGVQTSHRVWTPLTDVYVPLYLEEAPHSRSKSDRGMTGLAQLVNSRMDVLAALKDNRHVLIVGAPGAGKSTLLAYLATGMATGTLNLDQNGQSLPLLVAVRALEGASLTERSLSRHLKCDSEVVEQALTGKRACLLLDGLDEAPPELRGKLAASLKRLLKQHPSLRVIATSRPTGPPGEIEKQLGYLESFSLADFAREDVKVFVDKWCLAAELSVRNDHSEARKQARRAAEDLQRRIERSRSVQRIAVNPLLSTIICVVHRFLGHTIPERRVTLYEKCTDALLYEWDRAKFSESATLGQFDAVAKRRLLMGVARRIHEKHWAEISESEVIREFAKVLPELGRSKEEASNIVAEIRDRSGLLVERRPGHFAFSHLSFQEYLTALDFARNKSDKELPEYFEDSWWHEVIQLAAGIPGGNSEAIVQGLLNHKKRPAIILAARCLETAVSLPLSLRKQVNDSLERIIPPHTLEEARELGKLSVLVAPLLEKSVARNRGKARTLSLYALMGIDYEPAIPAIVSCVQDQQESSIGSFTVGEIATVILAIKSENSELALRTLEEALRLRSKGFLRFLHSYAPMFPFSPTVVTATKAAFQEKQSAKVVQSTA